MPRKEKHASKTANLQLAEAAFHPKVLAHAREQIAKHNAEAGRPKKTKKEEAI